MPQENVHEEFVHQPEMAAPTSRLDRPGSWSEGIAVVITTAIASLLTFPANLTAPFEPVLDADWQMALHQAAARHLAMGSAIEFTYGPLGYAFSGRYHPQTVNVVVSALMLFGAVAALALWRRFAFIKSLPLRAGATLVVIGCISATTAIDGPMFFASILLLREGLSRKRTHAIVLLLSAGAGALMLTKFTVAVAFAVVVGAILIHDAIMKRTPFPALMTATTFLLLWRATGQEFTGLPLFLRSAAAMSSGHVFAMEQGDQTLLRSITDPLLFGVAATALIALVYRTETDRVVRLLHSAALVVILLIVAKSTFVRHDLPHLFIGLEVLLFASIVSMDRVARQKSRTNAALLAVSGGVALIMMVATWRPYRQVYPVEIVRAPLRSMYAAGSFFRDPKIFEERYRVSAAGLRARTAFLHEVDGTFDAPSFGQAAVAAWNFDWSPRPTIHSYLSYTEGTQQRNALHYRSARAPGYVWLNLQPVDNHWPMMEDALALREILCRYDIANANPEGLLLRRRASGMADVLEELSRQTRIVHLGERIAVPRGLIWFSADARLSPLGVAAAALLRPSSLTMRVKIESDPAPRDFRLVPAMARSGFVLSPAVRTSREFGDLMNGRPLPHVEWIEIVETSQPLMWQPDLMVSVANLQRTRP